MSTSVMEVRIQPSKSIALATANVGLGWRMLTNTFGFCEECRLEFPQNRILRVQAAIHAWPNRFGVRLFRYPENVFGLLVEHWGRVELREQDLQIEFDMVEAESRRLSKSRLPGFYQQPVELDRQGRVGFWFSLLVVFSDNIPTEYPDVREWDTQFLMGGRYGSRRGH